MITLEQAAAALAQGHPDVIYTPRDLVTGCLRRDAAEHGVITMVNAHWVFVRYDRSATPKATAPGDLLLGSEP